MYNRRAIGMLAPIMAVCATLACIGAEPPEPTQSPAENTLATDTFLHAQELLGPTTTPLQTLISLTAPPTHRPTPALTQSPTPSQPPATNCDPSYTDVCIPSPPPDLDCGDITFR